MSTRHVFFIICFSFLIKAHDGKGQDILASQLRWTCPSAVDVSAGAAVDNPGYLVTYRQDSIVWKNADHSTNMKFVVTEISGAWDNVANTGEITFEVQRQGRNGNIRFLKSPSTVEIRVFIPDANTPIFFEFTSQPPTSLQ